MQLLLLLYELGKGYEEEKLTKKKILLWHTLPPADTEDYDLNISFNFLVTNKYEI